MTGGVVQVAADPGRVVSAGGNQLTHAVSRALGPDDQTRRSVDENAVVDGQRASVAENQVDIAVDLQIGKGHIPLHGIPVTFELGYGVIRCDQDAGPGRLRKPPPR